VVVGSASGRGEWVGVVFGSVRVGVRATAGVITGRCAKRAARGTYMVGETGGSSLRPVSVLFITARQPERPEGQQR